MLYLFVLIETHLTISFYPYRRLSVIDFLSLCLRTSSYVHFVYNYLVLLPHVFVPLL